MGLCCSSTRGQDSGNIVSKVIILHRNLITLRSDTGYLREARKVTAFVSWSARSLSRKPVKWINQHHHRPFLFPLTTPECSQNLPTNVDLMAICSILSAPLLVLLRHELWLLGSHFYSRKYLLGSVHTARHIGSSFLILYRHCKVTQFPLGMIAWS